MIIKSTKSRQYSAIDHAVLVLDSILNHVSKPVVIQGKRAYPAEFLAESGLDEDQKQHAAALMRVNHAGEVAAQALYRAQSLTARDKKLKVIMQQSAIEEIDHLNWCEFRLRELEAHPSLLQPVWYLGSFAIGMLAGCFGDEWNLGFLAETEHQVVRHLDRYLGLLPEGDQRSRAILEQMREDELHHAVIAETVGAGLLSEEVKCLMRSTSKIMTKIAYKI